MSPEAAVVCPACHHDEHDPGSCPECPRCELHTDEALDFVLRVEPGLLVERGYVRESLPPADDEATDDEPTLATGAVPLTVPVAVGDDPVERDYAFLYCECCTDGFYCRHRCPTHPKPSLPASEWFGQPWQLSRISESA